ncbi:phospho-N-acetylmuramoyl-pentapeptide-transferase [Paucilactobacillus oligofermentans DSM 15707 = LMG 22743]|uniref:Phospho-N-acetylmuramoyl-pentapeptide-transferase n=1 Tax=Paucilactobacillus oligofermentans DSM 15707 = LMG 22743 TaxID=1423778 RepID=A0A0R1RH94_9LACO|nr:phospho-N-acetylmuramoyl-pentapeptide-transferase [Paucilactobacillus oligofermentans]KRL54596.1 phospho-N-acetylmuramoyl-pentapeptide-transferase [Paucilactobacillus oligofermentans DSM 15707 = LMG 22743]CUS26495.1 Phospho-N-acetylmuramoyl-pentapeptide-transferaseMraY [Paucilactobacillus oligofermentans DSM 15707 = LMG 22743]
MNLVLIIVTLLISFGMTYIAMPHLIKYFRAKKEGQQIREIGPNWHASKAGTPTMGGLVFVIASTITAIIIGLLQSSLTNTMWAIILTFVLFGLIGMWDDSIKIFNHQNEGFKAWQKALAQIVVAMIFAVIYQHEGFQMGFGTMQFGWLYVLFIIFWLVGFSNAVNLSDGLDGLVAGLATISFLTYAIMGWYQHNYEVVIFCLAIVGALIAFFCFNKKPAKIFMGDMGSLALGGALAAVSIILHQEFSLLLIGIVYVVETASVILQVASFKLTGKRIFKMSPIHHHFEMIGWSEVKVDYVFWTVGLLGSILQLIIFFINI